AGVVDVDLVAATGGDHRLVRADGDGADRLDVGGRHADEDLGTLANAGGGLRALLDPQLDDRDFFRRAGLIPLRRHGAWPGGRDRRAANRLVENAVFHL